MHSTTGISTGTTVQPHIDTTPILSAFVSAAEPACERLERNLDDIISKIREMRTPQRV
jgi:hypothetical protein